MDCKKLNRIRTDQETMRQSMHPNANASFEHILHESSRSDRVAFSTKSRRDESIERLENLVKISRKKY